MRIPLVLRVQLQTHHLLSAVLASSFLFAACAQLTPAGADPVAVGDKVPARLRVEIGANVTTDVLVRLAEPAADSGDDVRGAGQALSTDLESLSAADARDAADALVEERAALYAELQERVLDAVSDEDRIELLDRYENVPMMFMRVRSAEALELLAAQPEVAQIYENAEYEHQLATSLPLIHQPEVALLGREGANVSVAVLDTGCDYTRAAFGSCSRAGGTCKVQYAADFATNDRALDDHGHGTNVSAIVLGVAPSAKVLALDVFNGPTAPSNAIIAAIDWTIGNRHTYNIVALNMSLGGGGSSSQCGTDVFASAVGNARSAGILSAIASGNNGFSTRLSSPACVPAAISVGAVYDANVGGVTYGACSDATTAADKITCFSNSASFLSMLAPGAPITAGNITMSGTSQATPHVAGAIAVLRSAFPSESVSELVNRLTGSGPEVTDPRNGVSKRRLDLQAALASGGADVTPPTGSVSINGGASATNTGTVTLAIQASDNGTVTQMCVSNTATCTSFGAFSPAKSWTLASGDGVKTVYVTLKDSAGNIGKLSDTIIRDAKAPSNPTLSASAGNASVSLSWTAATDAGSGMAGYKVVYSTTATAPASCKVGTVAYSGPATSMMHTPLTNGTLYNYRACAFDAAGNLSAGTVSSARPAPERNAPTGTVTINHGAIWTRIPSVTLTLSASDDSAVTAMCISNTATKCTSFVAYASSKTWSLSSTGSVFVWFRDPWGNTSATPASDSISLDKVAPSASKLTATVGNKSVALSWTPSSDSGSGLASYKLVWAKTASAPSCTAGAVAYSGTNTSFTHSALTAGKYSYRMCAYDVAGNANSGVTRTVTVP